MENPYAAPDAALDEPTADETYQPSMFSMSGRIGRLRYLAYSSGMMMIFGIAIAVLAGILAAVFGHDGALVVGLVMILAYIPIVVMGFVMMVRRLNDLNHSGWLSLLMLVPFLNAFLGLYLMFAPGTPTSNNYGPKPVKNSTGVIVASLIMPLVACIGILAAIAIPAYQSYVTHAKAASMQQVKPADE